MKFSDKTIAILKNFQGINPSLEIRPGNKIATMAKAKNMFAYANIEETFTQGFAIADLSSFIGCLSLFNEPELTFHSQYATIRQGNQSIRYTFCDPLLIVTPPDKVIKVTDPLGVFPIKAVDIRSLARSTGLLKLPEFSILTENDQLIMRSMDQRNRSGNEYSIVIAEEFHTPVNLVFQKETINAMIEADYDMALSPRGYVRFENSDVSYIISPEHT